MQTYAPQGIDFVRSLQEELSSQLGGTALAPRRGRPLARPDTAKLDEIVRANLEVRIPRLTRRTGMRMQRTEYFPSGRIVHESFETYTEETAEVLTARGSLFAASGNSLLERLLSP